MVGLLLGHGDLFRLTGAKAEARTGCAELASHVFCDALRRLVRVR